MPNSLATSPMSRPSSPYARYTALSERDRAVYRAYGLEGRDISEVAKEFGVSRNHVSQIKVRIDRRIVAFGRELAGKDQF